MRCGQQKKRCLQPPALPFLKQFLDGAKINEEFLMSATENEKYALETTIYS